MSLLSCLKSCGDFIAKQSETTYSDPAARVLAEQVLANKLLSIMFETTGTTSLRRKVKGKLPFGGWTETIARHVLDSLVRQLNAGAGVEPKLEKSMQRAHDIVKGGKIAYEYPNLLSAGATLTALGMLTIVVPEAVAALGFKKAEPTTDSFAAVWQCTYSNIPYRDFYKYLHVLEFGGKWRGTKYTGGDESRDGVAK